MQNASEEVEPVSLQSLPSELVAMVAERLVSRWMEAAAAYYEDPEPSTMIPVSGAKVTYTRHHSSLFKKGVEKLPPRLQEEVKTEPLVVLAICLGVLALLCCGVCCVCCRYRARIRRAAKRRAAAKAERRLDQEVLNPNGASYDEGYQL